jgi:regulator of replication initiation timing
MLDQATYLRQQYERAKREKEGIKGKLKSLTEEIKELKIENDDLVPSVKRSQFLLSAIASQTCSFARK